MSWCVLLLTLQGVVFLLALHHHRGIHRHCLGFFQRLSAIGKPALDQVDDGRYGLSGGPRDAHISDNYTIPNHPHSMSGNSIALPGKWRWLVISWTNELTNDQWLQKYTSRKLQTFYHYPGTLIIFHVFTAAEYYIHACVYYMHVHIYVRICIYMHRYMHVGWGLRMLWHFQQIYRVHPLERRGEVNTTNVTGNP